MKHKIIFVHGFGVKKDARGIFLDIKESLLLDNNFKDIEFLLIDLNNVTDSNENIHLNSLSKQAEILTDIYNKENVDDSIIDLICHSQGCVVASIANLPNIRKTFFLAPPTNNDLLKTINSFRDRPGTIINLSGESILMRKDGSRTIVQKDYWEDRRHIDYLDLYSKLSHTTDVIAILANQDETVSNAKVEESLQDIIISKIDGDHNFQNTSRVLLVNTIKNYLNLK